MKKKSLPVLVKLVQQNNEEAFNELYRRYYKLVRYIAFGMTKSDADTDEIVQEVFIQVQKSIRNLNNPEQFKAWLSRITYSKTKMLFRNHKDREMEDQYLDLLQNQEEQREDFIPRKKQRHNHDLEVLYQCIQNLKPDFREVLIFYYFSQMSIKEISEMTGKAEGTIKSRMLYAKQNLKNEVLSYERKTSEKLTFQGKTLEAALTSMGTKLLVDMKPVPIPTFKNVTIPTSTLTMLGKAMLVTAIGATSTYGVVKYQEMKQAEALQNEELQKQNTIITKLKEQKTKETKEASSFPVIKYKNETIMTAKQAYKTLIYWADCEKEMKERTNTEYQEIYPVYMALMENESEYTKLLETSHWQSLFEKNNK